MIKQKKGVNTSNSLKILSSKKAQGGQGFSVIVKIILILIIMGVVGAIIYGIMKPILGS